MGREGAGSFISIAIQIYIVVYVELAQLVEHWVWKLKDGGSNPPFDVDWGSCSLEIFCQHSQVSKFFVLLIYLLSSIITLDQQFFVTFFTLTLSLNP